MQDREPTDPMRAALSALMDGDRGAVDQACRAWRSDASARDDWHTYHLIGDLLRSDEHRCEPARDADFVARLRVRLADEPSLLAPRPTSAALAPPRARRLRAWMTPAAVAAGFVAVAAALVVTQSGVSEGDGGDRFARGTTQPSDAAVRVSTSPAAGSMVLEAVPVVPENATLIRSDELDRYLAAHRQHASTFAPGAPGGEVRKASAAGPGR